MLAQAIARLDAFARSLGEVSRVEGRITDADLVLEGPGLPASRVDRRGRVARVSLSGLSVRRTFSCDLQLLRRPRVERVRAADAEALYDALARFYAALGALHREHPQRFFVSGEGDIQDVLARAARFDGAESRREAARFGAAYPEPVEILPPDRYRDIVLKPAIGCPNAGCSFCAFYAGRRFRPLKSSEFGAHLDAVEALFGPLLAGRKGVFLGSASAASLADTRLLDVLAQIGERWGSLARGVATFLDPDHAPRRTEADWRALADAGLTRVVSGLETGLPELRQELGKSPDLDAFIAPIRAQRAAGLPVGLTVLAGVGDEAEQEPHVRETARVIEQMALGPDDLVYVSPVADSMPEDALERATRALIQALREHTEAPVAPYAMHRFGYFA